jgi:hypothetical protein
MDKTWFELKEHRKRRLADAVWVPLRTTEHIEKNGQYGYVGYLDEYFGLGSVAVPLDHREQAKNLGWSDIGVSHEQGVWATADHYKPVDVYQYNDRDNLGTELVLVQYFSADPQEWHLNQDLVFALNLLREDDQWLSPDEGYTVVARLRRTGEGKPIALEIRNEFLRDYLCARGMFLRLSWYRDRDVVVENVAEVGSPTPISEATEAERFELSIQPILEGGYLGDGSFAVFHVARNDVDEDEDVPLPGPETATNVTMTSHKGKREGRQLVRVMGEVWRNEEIEPAANSARIRRDRVPTGVRYFSDASGATLTSEELDDQDVMRWLWFRPEVVPALITHRGGELRWYTRDTGGVACSPGELTHFGLNQTGLVTVYAYDVAKLPLWQQRIWAGFNVPPDGGVSKELLSSQIKAVVAKTSAPEGDLPEILSGLDALFHDAIGSPLFRPHTFTDKLVGSISRFRALEPRGLFSLAKDLMRIVADRIDSAALQRIVPPPSGESWRSLKSLEKYLARISSPEDARKVIGPLAGAYDLRVADAHLPAEDLTRAYELTGIDPKSGSLEQGYRLIVAVNSALINVGRIVHANLVVEREQQSQ